MSDLYRPGHFDPWDDAEPDPEGKRTYEFKDGQWVPHPDALRPSNGQPGNAADRRVASDERFPALLPKDRCDSCGARAYVRIVVPSGLDLLLCGHHYRKHEPAILEGGYEVLDERRRIPKGGPSL